LKGQKLMTYNKKISFGKVAGVSLLSLVMMFAAIAPSMTQANAGGDDPPPTGTISKQHIEIIDNPECFTGIIIAKSSSTFCGFLISYNGDPAIVEDTVPAEWEVVLIVGEDFGFPFSGNCTFESAGKNVDKSATKITCDEATELVVGFIVQTRESPGSGKGNQEILKFKPTSCGDLVLNDGAVAYAGDGAGEKILVLDADGNLVPIVIDTSEPIVLTAINPDDRVCGSPEPDDEDEED